MNEAAPLLIMIFEALLAHFRNGGQANHTIVQTGLNLATEVLAKTQATPPTANK